MGLGYLDVSCYHNDVLSCCLLNLGPVIPVQFDNTCSSWDSSTVHLPVVSLSCSRPHIHNGSTEGEGQEGSSTADGGSGVCELDCRQEACPERTVCVRMGSVRSRCCWQSTRKSKLNLLIMEGCNE